MMKLIDAARNKWGSILPMLGIGGDHLTGKHGPCPVCGGKDRFRFDDLDGRGTFFCNGSCGAGNGVDLLMKKHGWTFAECNAAVRPILGDVSEAPTRRQRPHGDPRAACQRLWDQSRELQPQDEASRYLASRSLIGPYPADLRIVPDCPITHCSDFDHLPALVAMVRAPDGGGASLHRTYLLGGRKAPVESPRRMMPGSLPRGSAIRLGPYSDRLGVAEGIETALRVRQDFGLPCWSVLNATMLGEFECPADVRELHVFGDNDPKFGGQTAAYRAAHRVAVRPDPPAVFVHVPPRVGDDWLDHALREGAGRVAA